MLGTLHQLGPSVDEQVTESGPVFVIGIQKQGHSWLLHEIPNAPETLGRDSLWFLVHGGVEGLAVEGEAHGHDMGLPFSAEGREMGHALGTNESRVRFCPLHGITHQPSASPRS